MKRNQKLIISLLVMTGFFWILGDNAYCSKGGEYVEGGNEDLFPPDHGGSMGVGVFIQDINYTEIENRIGDFQDNNKIEGEVPELRLNLGYQRYRNLFECEMFVGWSTLDNFIDEHHSLDMVAFRSLIWYRRIIKLSNRFNRLHILPGAGIGYASVKATISYSEKISEERTRSGSEDLLKSSRISWAAGIRTEVRLVKWKNKNNSNSAIYLGVDYRYFFDDMQAKTVNEGDIFFPGGSEFKIAGNCFAIDLQFYFY